VLGEHMWEFTGGILGVGSFSCVYEAKSLGGGVHVAVKVTHVKPLSEWLRRQCEAESTIWSKLDHPHIPTFFGSVRSDDWLLLVSEAVTGGQLMEHISSRHCFTEAEASSIVLQLFSSVAHMHQHSICHRDIKPQNVLCVEAPPAGQDAPHGWRVKLCDFGMSKQLHDATCVMKTPCSSKHYVAPEMRTLQYDMKVDIWAIGCIAYLLLCGSLPPTELSECTECSSASQFEDDAWEEVSSAAAQFVRQLLAFDPRERPTAAEALTTKWLSSAPATPLLTPTILQKKQPLAVANMSARWSCDDSIEPDSFPTGSIPTATARGHPSPAAEIPRSSSMPSMRAGSAAQKSATSGCTPFLSAVRLNPFPAPGASMHSCVFREATAPTAVDRSRVDREFSSGLSSRLGRGFRPSFERTTQRSRDTQPQGHDGLMTFERKRVNTMCAPHADAHSSNSVSQFKRRKSVVWVPPAPV